jgi:hypothetical protein
LQSTALTITSKVFIIFQIFETALSLYRRNHFNRWQVLLLFADMV